MNHLERIRLYFAELGPVRLTLWLLAVLLFLFTGVSIFSRPDYEVLYSPTRLVLPLKEGRGILAFYSIEVGNTGRKLQESVKLKFLKTSMDRRIFDVSAKNFGVSDRPVSVCADSSVTTIDLGSVEPEKRIKVNFTLLYEARPLDEWEAIFQGIDVARGKAREGDPGMTMVARAWFDLFGRWLPF